MTINNKIDIVKNSDYFLQHRCDWHNPHFDKKGLDTLLDNPSERLWLNACYNAVTELDETWLTELPIHLISNSNKEIARFVADCALQAIYIIKDRNSKNHHLQILNSKYPAKSSAQIKDLLSFFCNEAPLKEEKTASVKVPLVVGNNGQLGQIELEKLPNGTGEIYPHPSKMIFSKIGEDFEESIKTAFDFITTTVKIPQTKQYNYRWSIFNRSKEANKTGTLDVFDEKIAGKSAGLGFALAFLDLFDQVGETLNKYAFTGELLENGTIQSVGGYAQKLAETTELTTYVPKLDEDLIKHKIDDKHKIVGVGTVNEAIADIKLKRKRAKQKYVGIIVGIIGGIFLIFSSILALLLLNNASNRDKESAILNEQTAKRNEQAALNEAESEKLKNSLNEQVLAQTKIESQNKDKEIDIRNKQLEIEKIEKLNEANKRKNAEKQKELAKKESKILAQKNRELNEKNIQLDKAKQVAEINEKEAKVQKGIAEKNEKIAQASKQVTYASRLAAEGYRRLADGDKNAAQTFFAKALSLDEKDEYRSALLNSTYNETIKAKLSWSERIDEANDELIYVSLASLDITGDFLAVAFNNSQKVGIINTQNGNDISTITFDYPITEISLSPAGKYLAVRTVNSKLIIWEISKSKVFFEMDVQVNEHDDVLSFNSDGKYLATVFNNNNILVLEVESKQIIKTFSHSNDLPNAAIFSIAFSPDNHLAYGITNLSFTYFGESPIFIRSINDDSEAKKITNSGSLNVNLGFTKNKLISSSGFINVMASASSEGDSNLSFSGGLTIFDDIEDFFSTQDQPKGQQLNQKVRPDILFAVVPNSDYFVSTGDHGQIRFWEGEKQLHQISFPMGKPVKIMMGKNGKVLFLNSNGKIYCWETNIDNYNEGKNNVFGSFWSFNPSRNIERYDDAVVIRDLNTDKIILSFKRDKSANNEPYIAVSPDGSKIGVLLEGEKLDVYDANTKIKTFEYNFENKIDVCCLKFSNDGQKLAVTRSTVTTTTTTINGKIQSVTESPSVNIFDLSNSNFQSKITLPRNLSKTFYLNESGFSPKGNFYVVRSDDSIYFFDFLSGQLKQSIPFPQTECNLPMSCSWFSISPDEKYVGITYLTNQTVQLWNIENFRYLVDVIKTGINSPELPVGVGFTKNSQALVWSSGSSGQLHFYSVKNNRKLADFPTDEMIFQITNSFDGNLIINGVKKLDDKNLNLFLSGSPDLVTSNIFSNNSFKINLPDLVPMNQESINSILTERNDFDMTAITKNGVEEKSESVFGGNEVMKVKLSADGKSNQCQIAFIGPIFNAYPVHFAREKAQPCTDYPVIDVTKDFKSPEFGKTREEYYSIREYHTGESLIVLLYINNGAANNLDPNTTFAKNVKITTSLTRDGSLHKISATFTADNAAPLTGTVTIRTNSDENLEIKPNSGAQYNNKGDLIKDRVNLNLGNSTFNLGELDGDWSRSLFLTYRIKVVKKP